MMPTVRFAFRALRKSPGFTIVAMICLAVGIGLTSTMFSVADALVLRPLPVEHASEVVTISSTDPGNSTMAVSYPDYLNYADKNRTFNGLIAYALQSFGFARTAADGARFETGCFVSPDFFRVLDIQPAVGRLIGPEDDTVPGREPVVVLSHAFYAAEFNSNPSAIGSAIRLNGHTLTIIGVAPAYFTGMDQFFRPDFFLPVTMAPDLGGDRGILSDRSDRSVLVKGRLKPGITIAQAQSDLSALAAAIGNAYSADRHIGVRVRTESGWRAAISPTDPPMAGMLLGIAICVLLVACANVAGLSLTRARARTKEMAVHLAVGARPWVIVWKMLTETLIVALAGGGLGILIADAGIRVLSRVRIPSDLPISLSFRLDARVVTVAIAAAVLSTLSSGLGPALRSANPDLVPALKQGDTEVGRLRRLWGRNTLVGAQICVSLVLVAVSVLLYTGIEASIKDPGFRIDRLAMVTIDSNLTHSTDMQARILQKKLLESTRSTPGIQSAALAGAIPFSVNQGQTLIAQNGETQTRRIPSVSVSTDYFESMGVRMLRGREIRETDTASAPLIAVVNRAFADRFLPARNPVGESFHLESFGGPLVHIVGESETAKCFWIGEGPTPFIYFALQQRPQTRVTLLAHTLSSAEPFEQTLTDLVHQIDRGEPVLGIMTMGDYFNRRAVALLDLLLEIVATMSLLGLVLAMVGLYALTSYAVSRRTREIGIRMALGASSSEVLGSVAKRGLVLSFVGVAVGIGVSLFAARIVEFLFVAARVNFRIIALAALVEIAVTLIALYLPARRAARIDPMRTIREE